MKEGEESFRDSISTVDKQGKRVWLFPKQPKGSFYNKRKLFSYLLLLALFGIPFLSINGNPVFMFNIIERKFSILGKVFWPDDLYVFALAMVVMVFVVALFTVVFGRLFCGWICPQTIFMEMVFRRIEYWIEGDWKAQQKLKKRAWDTDKVLRKGAKHGIFFFISFLIANTFLMYIIGWREVFDIITDHPKDHIVGLISILIFTTIFYLVFSKMREQVCTVVCPYGRLQGVLLDNNSLVVAYDYKRGENRQKFNPKKAPVEGAGDCIDCNKCVHVCPTGIDIRNGTQLECVNCTACMDACNAVMEKVDRPKDLIRFASIQGIEDGKGFRMNGKAKGYTAVLVGLMTLLSFLILTRDNLDVTVIRTRGTLVQQVDGQYSNIFDLSISNKTNDLRHIELKLAGIDGKVDMVGREFILEGGDTKKAKFLVLIPSGLVTKRQMDIEIEIYADGEYQQSLNTSFMGPI